MGMRSIKFMIWGLSAQYSYDKLKYIQDSVPNCEFVGITSNQNLSGCIDGILFYKREDICKVDFDYLLVTPSKHFSEIRKEATLLGVHPDKIISQEIFFLSGFAWDKYEKLRKSNLSIISQGCWGGIIYSLFSLPFLSPTINLSFDDRSYINFLKNLNEYTRTDLIFSQIEYNQIEKKITPIYHFDDEVEIHMIHYTNFDESVRKWHERCKRINWDNILVVMITENPKIAYEFDMLPFKKKICFASFKSELDSVWYIPVDVFFEKPPFARFWRCVHLLAHQGFSCYDLWELLLYGKKKARWSILE